MSHTHTKHINRKSPDSINSFTLTTELDTIEFGFARETPACGQNISIKKTI